MRNDDSVIYGSETNKMISGISKGVYSTDVITGELRFDVTESGQKIVYSEKISDLELKLNEINSQLDDYTNHAGKADYALAVVSGIVAGVIDSLYVGELKITSTDIGIAHRNVNEFIEKYAKKRGLDGKRLARTIQNLEDEFPVPQDNVWKGQNIKVTAKNHHLDDLAHHPTPIGLLSAILVRLLRFGTFVNRDGEIHLVPVKTTKEDFIGILIPAIMCGVLNWLVDIGKQKLEDADTEFPEGIYKLAHLAASLPILAEIAKCADNWFGHLVSDMGGSKQTAGDGMGIPGLFISLLHEMTMIPGINKTKLPEIVNDLYQNEKINLRKEIPLYKELSRQAIPVIFNEVVVRIGFFISHLYDEYTERSSLFDVDWNRIVPVNNATIDRMLTVSTVTFNVADTVDAAVRAAVESGGNWVIFAGRFVTRFNYVGAARATVAIVKEISNSEKEYQILKEKRILVEAKSAEALRLLEEYKAKLEENISNYLAQDISAFLEGFEYMDSGLVNNDSDLVIKGNVIIQKVLGREPQFTSQKEFDELMASSEPLKL